MKDLLLGVRIAVETLNLEISRRLADDVKEFYLSACCTCSTVNFLHFSNQNVGLYGYAHAYGDGHMTGLA